MFGGLDGSKSNQQLRTPKSPSGTNPKNNNSAFGVGVPKETPFGPPKQPRKRNKTGKKLMSHLDESEITNMEKQTPFIK